MYNNTNRMRRKESIDLMRFSGDRSSTYTNNMNNTVINGGTGI